jgi:hypothetical protein
MLCYSILCVLFLLLFCTVSMMSSTVLQIQCTTTVIWTSFLCMAVFDFFVVIVKRVRFALVTCCCNVKTLKCFRSSFAINFLCHLLFNFLNLAHKTRMLYYVCVHVYTWQMMFFKVKLYEKQTKYANSCMNHDCSCVTVQLLTVCHVRSHIKCVPLTCVRIRIVISQSINRPLTLPLQHNVTN